MRKNPFPQPPPPPLSFFLLHPLLFFPILLLLLLLILLLTLLLILFLLFLLLLLIISSFSFSSFSRVQRHSVYSLSPTEQLILSGKLRSLLIADPLQSCVESLLPLR